MDLLQNGTLFLRSDTLEETNNHISRFSLRTILNGDQHYHVDKKDIKIKSGNFLILNKGQTYSTHFRSTVTQEMMVVAFKPGFAENIAHVMTTDHHQLLDDPFKINNDPLSFFENEYPADRYINYYLDQLRSASKKSNLTPDDLDFDSIYTSILERFLYLHQQVWSEINNLDVVKKVTKEELYRRLSKAKSFMDSYPNQKMSLDTIAAVACLSVHHFKRLFKTVFKISPHQYLIQRRMLIARDLLIKSGRSINEVCFECGFENSSSFIRLFHQHFNTTPHQFRKNH